MMDKKSWLIDWRLHLLEIFIATLSVCSGLTTFMGARKLVNESWLVAALFTMGIQGSMYIVAHRATLLPTGPRRRRVAALYSVWSLLALFSVYSSALGMFELQKGSLRNDHEHAALTSEWRAALDETARFRTEALTIVRARARETGLQIAFEKNREQAHRRALKPYSPKEKQTLNARAAALADAERKILTVRTLPAAAPSNLSEARDTLDSAFAQAADAYASLPEDCRAQVQLPRRLFGASVPVDLQKAFWMELQIGSAPAIIMLVIAFLLDVMPMAIRYACRPRRSLSQFIRAARLSLREVWSALSKPIGQEQVTVRLEVEDYSELDIEMTFAADGGGPYLEDLHRHFEVVERAVTEISGEQVQVAEVFTSSGEPLSPDAPVAVQLDGNDRTIRLRLAGAVL